MTTYLQADRVITLSTPLGRDDLLPVGFTGQEAISQPFLFRLDLIVENTTSIPFECLLGRKITIHLALPNGRTRHFSGICKSVRQGARDFTFTSYQMEVVPELWLLSKKVQSRIFQQVSVPEILKQVLAGLDVVFELQGNFAPRDYCVQYRESDLNFASRLMEEEGIYYFFMHSANGHTMVVADDPRSHPDLPEGSVLTFEVLEQADRGEARVHTWEKVQELRSGRFTLRDHCFELPDNHLEAEEAILDGVATGGVNHKLHVAHNEKLEIYDYPGAYAQRFDGVDPGGGDRPADLKRIFEDNRRTVAIRMQQEAMPGLIVEGSSACRNLVSGYKFTLEKHFNADGPYLLTGVQHSARIAPEYRSSRGGAEGFVYRNSFSCIPFGLPYRPARKTPRPTVQGTQTAVVVGPAGEEIFTDKYGRVKVQFHWDRQGKNDGNSSCWIRVASSWAGSRWGGIHIPRVGQEVLVDFLEGDPDRPIVVGSVYNADMMPPYPLPANKTQSGIKSRSTPGGTPTNFNELRFEDLKGSEDIYFQAEKDFHRVVKHDDDLNVGNDQTIAIQNNRTEVVKQGDEKVTIEQGNRTIVVATGDDIHDIQKGNRTVEIDMGNDSLTIKMGDQTTKLDMGKSETEAMQSIELKVGQSSVKLDQTGVTIKGMMITIEGQVQTQVKGVITQVIADAMLQLKGGITMIG